MSSRSARSPPTNTTRAPSARSASATASAGTTCPAVPPAPITTSGALTSARRAPPAACAGPALPVLAAPLPVGGGDRRLALHHLQASGPRPRDVEQDSHRGQHHTQVRRCIGDERQRHTGERRQSEHDEDVEESLAED